VGGSYGPAGAFVVLLVWTYYSSLIVLMGAELTRGVAEARGKGIRPSTHAVRIEAAPAEIKAHASRPVPKETVAYRKRAVARLTWVATGVLAGVIVARHRR